jgi:hypothetical protein
MFGRGNIKDQLWTGEWKRSPGPESNSPKKETLKPGFLVAKKVVVVGVGVCQEERQRNF